MRPLGECIETSAFNDAARSVIALHPVALAHVLDTDFRTGAWRVQEAVVTEVDADMGKGAAHGVEENQIARLQLVLVDDVANLALFLGRSRKQFANRFPEDDLDKAAAIESTVGISATEAIVDADQLQALENQILRTAGVAFEQGRLVAESLLLLFGSLRNARAG